MSNFRDLVDLEQTGDAAFVVGEGGVNRVKGTADRKVEFVSFQSGKQFALVKSAMGYPAYYPVHDVKIEKPLRAVLMDLDGTTVHSEHFWIWIIEKTTASLLGDPKFELEGSDEPHVSGHSVSEHLQYCIDKYCPDKSVEEARKWYFKHTNFEMNEIMEGRGKPNAFTPSPGIKDFLYELKDMGVKIGLVTSGLYEKAWPEILDAFKTLNMCDPKEFYDAIIIHALGVLMNEHGGEGTKAEKDQRIREWVLEQRAIAKTYGHDEVYMALGAILPQFSKWFKGLGFDGCFTYVTDADESLETVTPIEYELPNGQIRTGELHEADYETVMMPSHKIFWDKMYQVWGAENYFPTLTVREDWRHWGPQRMLYYHGCTPDVYAKALEMAKEEVLKRDARKFVTVGIWNEVYEDGYLQPDVKYGYEYGKRIKAAFSE